MRIVPRSGVVDACEQAEERRLAGTVRADEPDPRLRRHDEVDAVEDDLCSIALGNACCDERYFNGNDLRMSAGSACALTHSGVVAYCGE